MEVATVPPAKKPKRLTSVVWNHFERIRKADVCYAVCVHCKKKLSGSSNSGTTHLRNHLLRCLKRSSYDVSQILAVKRTKKERKRGERRCEPNRGNENVETKRPKQTQPKDRDKETETKTKTPTPQTETKQQLTINPRAT